MSDTNVTPSSDEEKYNSNPDSAPDGYWNRYIAKRYLNVGDERIAPGEEVPVDSSWAALHHLIGNGDLVEVPGTSHRTRPASQAPAQIASDASKTPEQSQEGQKRSEGSTGDSGGLSGDSTDTSFDPTQHTAEEVLDYAADHEDEISAILEKERASSKPRKTVLALADLLD